MWGERTYPNVAQVLLEELHTHKLLGMPTIVAKLEFLVEHEVAQFQVGLKEVSVA
jgi:hypothetical protein